MGPAHLSGEPDAVRTELEPWDRARIAREYPDQRGVHRQERNAPSVQRLQPADHPGTAGRKSVSQYQRPADLCEQSILVAIWADHQRSEQRSVVPHRAGVLSLQLPYPQFTGVATDVQLIANSIYHGLQLLAEKRYSNGLQFLVTYTWSKSIDDSSQADDNVTWLGSFTSLQDPNKPWLERSLSTFDIPQVFSSATATICRLGAATRSGEHAALGLDAIVGGWKTNGIWRISDGRPLTFMLADGIALPTYGGQRPNIVGTPRAQSRDGLGRPVLRGSQRVPAPGRISRWATLLALTGAIRSPWSFTTDLSLAKQFSLARFAKR